MKATKKIIALGLCASMMFSLFGCKDKKQVDDNTTTEPVSNVSTGSEEADFTIPYIRTSSLNPFKTDVDANLHIATLLYDSLFSVDNTFKAVPLIADSYIKNGTKINVKLKAVRFTDGTAVTADDVVYSFVEAKKSSNYNSYLDNISDCSKVNNAEVVFTLRSNNPYEVANLFFPIVKKDSTDGKADSVPVGSGRYTIITENGLKYLYYNKDRLGGYKPKYNKIGFKDSSDTSSISTLFAVGNVDIHCENFSEGIFVRYTGTPFNKEMTHFTFLGINGDRSVFNNRKVRRAISLLLDRDDISAVSFSGLASAASTPFSPEFYGIKGCTLPSIKQDKEAAIELLKEAGFNKINADGVRCSDEHALSLSLAVNSENTFRVAVAKNIQTALEQANIRVNIVEHSYSGYIETIETGNYDIYVGEVRLTNSFDLTHFFDGANDISLGVNLEGATAKKYREFESGSAGMQELIDTYADDLPFISIAFRHGVAIRSDKIKTDIKPIVSDYFYNIDEWTA